LSNIPTPEAPFTFAAIDPGLSGGVAVMSLQGNQHSVSLHKMPEDQAELSALLPFGCTVVIEKVPPFVGRLIPSSASFKLGKSAGWVEGFCAGRQHPVILVTPQKWQAGLGIPKGSKTQSQWKSALKGEASRRYPSAEGLTLATADALLIADWFKQHLNHLDTL
jgi:hypothetical protein